MEKVHVVQAFRWREGYLAARPPLQFKNSERATLHASEVAADYAGVIAYSMTINEDAGDYSDPEIHFQAGLVPELG